MVLEFALITVRQGSEASFEQAVAAARPLLLGAPGCHGVELHRVIERPEEYLLIVRWERLEDHTERFRNSEAFQRWRELAGPHFAAPPTVSHTTIVG